MTDKSVLRRQAAFAGGLAAAVALVLGWMARSGASGRTAASGVPSRPMMAALWEWARAQRAPLAEWRRQRWGALGGDAGVDVSAAMESGRLVLADQPARGDWRPRLRVLNGRNARRVAVPLGENDELPLLLVAARAGAVACLVTRQPDDRRLWRVPGRLYRVTGESRLVPLAPRSQDWPRIVQSRQLAEPVEEEEDSPEHWVAGPLATVLPDGRRGPAMAVPDGLRMGRVVAPRETRLGGMWRLAVRTLPTAAVTTGRADAHEGRADVTLLTAALTGGPSLARTVSWTQVPPGLPLGDRLQARDALAPLPMPDGGLVYVWRGRLIEGSEFFLIVALVLARADGRLAVLDWLAAGGVAARWPLDGTPPGVLFPDLRDRKYDDRQLLAWADYVWGVSERGDAEERPFISESAEAGGPWAWNPPRLLHLAGVALGGDGWLYYIRGMEAWRCAVIGGLDPK